MPEVVRWEVIWRGDRVDLIGRRRRCGEGNGALGFRRCLEVRDPDTVEGWIFGARRVRITVVKALIAVAGLTCALIVATASPARAAAKPLFDGKTFAGWEGDTDRRRSSSWTA